MIEVEVFGAEPPCVKCKKTEEAAKRAAAKFPGRVTVTKVSALSEQARALGLSATPAVAVNGRLVAQGRVPEQAEFEDIFRTELGG